MTLLKVVLLLEVEAYLRRRGVQKDSDAGIE